MAGLGRVTQLQHCGCMRGHHSALHICTHSQVLVFLIMILLRGCSSFYAFWFFVCLVFFLNLKLVFTLHIQYMSKY